MEYFKGLYNNDYACKFGSAAHIGFMLNTSTYSNLGFNLGDKNYVPVFIFDDEGPFFVEETETYSSLPKYIVFFKGCDDCSYGLRFDSREERSQFIADHLGENCTFTEFIRTKCLYSN